MHTHLLIPTKTKMGYDIEITSPTGKQVNHFYITCNHVKFKEYFYSRQYNGCKVKDVLVALGSALKRFREEGITPFPLQNTNQNIHHKSVDEKYYEATKEVFMSILIIIQHNLMSFNKEDDIWNSD